MRRAFFITGLGIAGIALVLMVRQLFQIPPFDFEIQARQVSFGIALIGCAFARFGVYELEELEK